MFSADRLGEKTTSVKGKLIDLWYSGKAGALLRGLRCLGERGFAVLTGRWRTLHHITASPRKIGNSAKAALVLTHFEQGRLT